MTSIYIYIWRICNIDIMEITELEWRESQFLAQEDGVALDVDRTTELHLWRIVVWSCSLPWRLMAFLCISWCVFFLLVSMTFYDCLCIIRIICIIYIMNYHEFSWDQNMISAISRWFYSSQVTWGCPNPWAISATGHDLWWRLWMQSWCDLIGLGTPERWKWLGTRWKWLEAGPQGPGPKTERTLPRLTWLYLNRQVGWMAATIGENSPAKYQPPGGMLRGYHDTNPPKSTTWTILNCSELLCMSGFQHISTPFKSSKETYGSVHILRSSDSTDPTDPTDPRSHTLRAFHPSSWPKRWILCLPCWPQITKSSNYTSNYTMVTWSPYSQWSAGNRHGSTSIILKTLENIVCPMPRCHAMPNAAHQNMPHRIRRCILKPTHRLAKPLPHRSIGPSARHPRRVKDGQRPP